MNIDRVIEAGDVLAWLSEQARVPGELRVERLQMGAVLALARLFLADYAAHITRGMEPYDALIASAKGETPLTAAQRDIARSLMPPLGRPDESSA